MRANEEGTGQGSDSLTGRTSAHGRARPGQRLVRCSTTVVAVSRASERRKGKNQHAGPCKGVGPTGTAGPRGEKTKQGPMEVGCPRKG
jgi:hypothetical protein